MKSMRSAAPGGPETLTLTESETPDPGRGEARIAVKAAGVNFPDTLIIRDLYQFKPPRPFAPGGEVAGVVEALGADCDGLAVGDRVLAGGVNGGYATHFVAPRAQVKKIPDAMPFDEAAAFLLTYGTAHYALKDRGRLQPDEAVLVLGAAGGVGAAAIEVAKAMGARTVAAVSSDEKAAFCRDLGADEAIVYARGALDRTAQKAFSAEIKAAAGRLGRSEGVDVALDPVGGDYAEPALRALGWDGRFLVVGFPAGIPAPPLNLTLLKSASIVGVFWGAFTLRDPARHDAHVAELFRWYEEGRVKPRITARFPLEDAADALQLIETRAAQGKVVLTVD
ncbi:MAG: NADPH:quinone oxidoreductase family protein [Parvularculaceae bacterium]